MIAQITTLKEVEYCVDMYLSQNDYTFLSADRDLAIMNLSLAVRRKKFVRVLKMDDKIVSWIFADKGNSLHMKTNILQQYYYCSELKGIQAYRSVKLLHNALIDYAEKMGYELIMSPGSHLDEDYTFTRILEKLGWLRRGHISIYKTSHYH
jgi:hypothetical protein